MKNLLMRLWHEERRPGPHRVRFASGATGFGCDHRDEGFGHGDQRRFHHRRHELDHQYLIRRQGLKTWILTEGLLAAEIHSGF